MAYTIAINDDQRQALIDLIRPLGDLPDNHPLQFWNDILTNLPTQEKETPGVLHGFCY